MKPTRLFPNLEQVMTASYSKVSWDARYIMGVYWSTSPSYCSIVSFDAVSHRMIDIARYNGGDDRKYYQYVRNEMSYWKPVAAIGDAVAMGDVAHRLQADGLPIIGMKTSMAAYSAMYSKLAKSIREDRISLLKHKPLADQLASVYLNQSGEFNIWGGERDLLSATALAWWGVMYSGLRICFP